ncbi:putative disease resistance RPP13-like protein 1 [Vicia villosa]|uniref:putative disease resistance RPP13-like protein 1 n=1 Tax=Vicia villosa TaxID=3911 RepID=UPI00273AAAB9|nr:putative disease resistance RPP13-like protein 1 [Vicia villosa]XP_058721609.1 putative disease resistance RPP13-like protein 1 [Vicia villosa]XP_058721610.1 putative disease resistance RPP13-like protein 1 [Vicia villosa]XP_058721611.1 putative disease resistance RPP13-like protein 1 [Vicia villosa]
MATIVGGALLSASMEMLVKKVVSGEFLDLFQRTKLDNVLLEKLKITLLSLQSVLHDAEAKQIDNPAVKEWLIMLQDAVFQVDDLFDEINTEALRRQVEADQVLKKLSSPFKRFNKNINSKLPKLFDTLEHLRKQKLGLKEGDSNYVWNVTPTTSVVGDESAIYGRDADKKKLKEFLLSEDGYDGGSKIGVISIVGMGGLGKTTLAKLLYNDHHVKNKFKVRGWAHIPKDLDIFTVTKTILESVTAGTIADTNLDNLQVQLQQTLSNTKFLLVLDDIWYGKYVGWNNLIDIFNVGQKGSKIIISTRDERVVLPMQKFLYVHHLRSLETEDSWSLLARHAFVETNHQKHPNLEIIGRKIAKKCGGLPLAAVALGGILRTNLSQDHWSDVLNNSIWEQTNDDVQPALLLSYRFLPASLKGCFAYCSIFPKNSILIKKMVAKLWIAEGLVPRPESEKNWEKVAEKYFDELVSRSLIRQRFLARVESGFEMHDLINDLAMTASFPYCIRLDDHKPDQRVRHLSYDRVEYNSFDKFVKLHGLIGLRTFLPMPLQGYLEYDNSVSWKLIFDLLSKMTHLHVLSLSHYKIITELPNSIGNLKYLRYLNLSSTEIKRLPSETCKLYNLQTLLLSSCQELTELPKDIGKLAKLRHLDIKGTPLEEMPIQLSRLENLQTLSDFIVSSVKDVGLKIEDLGKFPHLRGSLSISKLENVIEPSHASQANLGVKKEIDELELGWSYSAPSNSKIQSVVLERLRPSINLKSLTFSRYGGDKLPNWLGDPLFSNMVKLTISKCNVCSKLPSLGQLGNLKELSISEMQSIKSVDTVFYGSGSPSFQPFTSLEILSFKNMPEWEEWKMIGGTSIEFPSLKCLSLNECPKLKENIPINLPKLEILSLENCSELKGIAPNNLPSLIELELQDCPLLTKSRNSDDITSPPFDIFSQLMTSMNSLQKMTLKNISSVTSFSRDGLPKTLQSLIIEDCENLTSLPESIKSLTSLQKMSIIGLPNLQSFSIDDFPITLRELRVGEVGGILWNTTWEHLTSLSKLHTRGDDMLKGLMKRQVRFLPTNLTLLCMACLEDIECLDGKWLQHLTSLRTLYIDDAPMLKSLPEKGELPSSLKVLHIIDCPLLVVNLRRKQGNEWSKISHIPKIYVNYEIIKGSIH